MTSSREKILLNAEKLFFKYGYANTSLNEIADISNLKKSTLYHYFQSKEDLFFNVLTKSALDFHEEVKKVLQKAGSTRESLEKYAYELIFFSLKKSSIVTELNRIVIELDKAMIQKIMEDVRARQKVILFYVKKAMKENKMKGEPHDVLDFFVGAIHGMTAKYFLAKKKVDQRTLWAKSKAIVNTIFYH